MRPLSIIAGTVLLAALGQNASAQSADRHPQARYLHIPDVPHTEASLDDTPAPAPFVIDGTVLAGFGSEMDPHVIHTFQLNGGGGADFGRFYESPNPGINLSLNRGLVACDAQHNLIYFALNGAFGEIRAFRPDGTPVWRSSIDGFRSNIIASEANGGLSRWASPPCRTSSAERTSRC